MQTTSERSLKLKKAWEITSAVSAVITALSFIIGSLIQSYFLRIYNGVSFFSISQTFVDALYVFTYVFLFIIIPILIVPFLIWDIYPSINKEWKSIIEHIGLLIICLGLYYIIQKYGRGVDLNVICILLAVLLLLNRLFYRLRLYTDKEYFTSFINKPINIFIIIISCLILLFIVSSLWFSFTIENLLINGLIFSIISFGWVSAYLILSAFKVELPAEEMKEPNIRSKEILFWFAKFVFIRLKVSTLLGLFLIGTPIWYITTMIASMKQQYINFWYAVIENQRSEVLYKNDEYIFVSVKENDIWGRTAITVHSNLFLQIDKQRYDCIIWNMLYKKSRYICSMPLWTNIYAKSVKVIKTEKVDYFETSEQKNFSTHKNVVNKLYKARERLQVLWSKIYINANQLLA